MAKSAKRKQAPTAPEPVGRPSAYEPEFAARAKELCEEAGATDAELAQEFGVSSRTILTWRGKHPEFRAACVVGKDVANDRVKRSLYQRAVGWMDLPPETRACEVWLFNRDPKEWRNRTQHEVSGPDGGPITTEGTASDLEIARLIARVLLKAGAMADDSSTSAQKPAASEAPPDADPEREPEPA